MSRTRQPAERLVKAVEALDVQPEDSILEIGCGRGEAAALICQRLRGGRLHAIDRSATATTAATERIAAHIESGTATVETVALEAVEVSRLGRFHKVLAVNVNAFWVRPAQPELHSIARLLQPGGRLHLVYDAPEASRLDRIRELLVDHLDQAGYTSIATSPATQGSPLLAVAAHRG